ncbi:MAG TPA: (2Fe-2S)-binding protein [Candidatus Marinimicrobia bacterium]|jgi:aerobic-type carbon monoxide dehydrogenase small subunit (CoxS/CutS family)|nr:(2Fe-2S)-binding protein [Candidatus Neomarinimicrobiota bacterium]
MSEFSLLINGEQRTVNVDSDTPLLWVIRDTLGYTGTKFGCGRGLCGACTIHLDGEAIRSCVTSIDMVEDNSEITTIEGLSEDNPHPIQQAWLEEDVPQCGYCQSGQIMTASAFLKRNPNPDETDIDSAMKMNICRCGTYPQIKKAIFSAANNAQSSTGGDDG